MDMISVNERLSREISEMMTMSSFLMRLSSRPSLRFFGGTLPLTVSTTHVSTFHPFSSANLRISSFWFSGFCFSVLTLKYPIIIVQKIKWLTPKIYTKNLNFENSWRTTDTI